MFGNHGDGGGNGGGYKPAPGVMLNLMTVDEDGAVEVNHAAFEPAPHRDDARLTEASSAPRLRKELH